MFRPLILPSSGWWQQERIHSYYILLLVVETYCWPLWNKWHPYNQSAFVGLVIYICMYSMPLINPRNTEHAKPKCRLISLNNLMHNSFILYWYVYICVYILHYSPRHVSTCCSKHVEDYNVIYIYIYMYIYIYKFRIMELCIKLLSEASLYYDARSEKHQNEICFKFHIVITVSNVLHIAHLRLQCHNSKFGVFELLV
jgi:hypothetical protein